METFLYVLLTSVTTDGKENKTNYLKKMEKINSGFENRFVMSFSM